jgi:hypothetical protein
MAMIPHAKQVFGDLPEKIRAGSKEIPVPREIMVRLIDLYISCWDFDEEWYLANNADVREAISRGLFPSGWAHFRSVGYLEGRFGFEPVVDSEWYLDMYPDVAKAILAGKVASARDHYLADGYKEGRLPRDPRVNRRWYAPRYMADSSKNATEDEALKHFVLTGYRHLAVPAPPR